MKETDICKKIVVKTFFAVVFKAGKRMNRVTERSAKKDFAMFVKEVLDRYLWARKLHLILDNLNTHFAGSFEETFGEERAKPNSRELSFIMHQSMAIGSTLQR